MAEHFSRQQRTRKPRVAQPLSGVEGLLAEGYLAGETLASWVSAEWRPRAIRSRN